MTHQHQHRQANTKCEIKGEAISYDMCKEDSVQDPKDFVRFWNGSPSNKVKYEYIGSSHIFYFDGVRSENEKLHHFFKIKR